MPPDANPFFGSVSVAISPDGRHIYVASATENTISSFLINGRILAPHELISPVALLDLRGDGSLLAGPGDLRISADGSWLVVACRSADSLLFRLDVAAGSMTFSGAISDGVDGVDELNGVSVAAFSPDGKSLYAGGYYDDSVVRVSYDETFDGWEYEAGWDDGGDAEVFLHYPRAQAGSLDRSKVYVGASGNNALTAFSRSRKRDSCRIRRRR